MWEWLSQNAQAIGLLVGVPSGALAIWRFLAQHDRELKAPYRMRVLDQTFDIAQSVGEYLNAIDKAQFNAAWDKLMVIYNGPGQLIGDHRFYVAFAAFRERTGDLEFDTYSQLEGEEYLEIERLAFEVVRGSQRLLNRHWGASLSFVPRALPRRKKPIAA